MYRRICAGLMLGFCLAWMVLPCMAVEDSTTQMKLVASNAFLIRVQYLAWDTANTILAEAHATACHSSRIALAQEVLSSGIANVQKIALGIARSNAGGRVILGTVVDNANVNLVDSSASDLALASAINFYWNTIAKCDTGT